MSATTPSAGSARRVVVRRLVLDGVSPAQRDAVVDAFRQTLAELLDLERAEGAARPAASPRDASRQDPVVAGRPGAGAEIGERLARAVHTRLLKGGAA